MKKKIRLFLLVIFLIVLLGNPFAVMTIRQWSYDLSYSNSVVGEQNEIKRRLDRFDNIPFAKLGRKYLKETNSDLPKYKKLLQVSSMKK